MIDKEIDKWVTLHKTSWRWLKRKGLDQAEEWGDCIFLKVFEDNAIEDLKKRLKTTLNEDCAKVSSKEIVYLCMCSGKYICRGCKAKSSLKEGCKSCPLDCIICGVHECKSSHKEGCYCKDNNCVNFNCYCECHTKGSSKEGCVKNG